MGDSVSHGHGWQQRLLIRTLYQCRKATAFAEILTAARPDERSHSESDVRSMRRALQKLVKEGAVVTLGEGNPRDPYRYRLSAAMAKAMADQE